MADIPRTPAGQQTRASAGCSLGSLCRQYDSRQLQRYDLFLGYTYCNVRDGDKDVINSVIIPKWIKLMAEQSKPKLCAADVPTCRITATSKWNFSNFKKKMAYPTVFMYSHQLHF